ncbi:MAG: type IV toxin-antitoxin system AbiEi family antitoxin [Burkholderiales bacterium]
MFVKYLERLRSDGRRHFTFKEIVQELNLSEVTAKSGIYRLKKAGKIISPLKGLYVIVPPEYTAYGSIPAEELVPIIMKQLGAKYYVSLLSAAAFHGATHQKIFKFQIITEQRITHPLKFGQIKIDIIHKKSLSNLPTQDFIVSTGYLKVATPELTALDLFKYSNRAGGISHIATVLSELVENIGELYQIQRIGFVTEKIDVMDEEKKTNLVATIAEYLQENKRPYISLVPSMPIIGAARCKKWKIIENTDFESDL